MLETELLRAVYDAPLEDAPRLVYGDWLLERGDPRGELIALQFARRIGPRPVESARREADLLARFERSWLGALGGPVVGPGFERGFVARARIAAEDPAISATLGVDEWATVESLTVVHRGTVLPSQSAPARLAARLKGLREVTIQSDAYATAAWIEVLAGSWSRLSSVELKSPGLSVRLRRPSDGRFGMRLHARFQGTWFARAAQASTDLFSALRALPASLIAKIEVVDPRHHNKLTRRELRQLHRLLERFPFLDRVKLPRS